MWSSFLRCSRPVLGPARKDIVRKRPVRIRILSISALASGRTRAPRTMHNQRTEAIRHKEARSHASRIAQGRHQSNRVIGPAIQRTGDRLRSAAGDSVRPDRPSDPHRISLAGGDGDESWEANDAPPASAEVWGPGYGTESNYLRLYVRQLRQKLVDDPARPQWITTEPGLGYRWLQEPARE
jgi:hypothetical protein